MSGLTEQSSIISPSGVFGTWAPYPDDEDTFNKIFYYSSYVPIFSLYPGITKITLAIIASGPDTTAFRISSLFRGTVEVMQLGALFIPVDTYIYYKRHQFIHMNDHQTENSVRGLHPHHRIRTALS